MLSTSLLQRYHRHKSSKRSVSKPSSTTQQVSGSDATAPVTADAGIVHTLACIFFERTCCFVYILVNLSVNFMIFRFFSQYSGAGVLHRAIVKYMPHVRCFYQSAM